MLKIRLVFEPPSLNAEPFCFEFEPPSFDIEAFCLELAPPSLDVEPFCFELGHLSIKLDSFCDKMTCTHPQPLPKAFGRDFFNIFELCIILK